MSNMRDKTKLLWYGLLFSLVFLVVSLAFGMETFAATGGWRPNRGNSGSSSNEQCCAESGCDETVEYGETYCSKHKCACDRCSNKKIRKHKYCEDHTCDKKGCFAKVKDNSNYCKKHSSAASRSKEAEWPDCDDYEDFEEFMDDWDGHMPDGSDAEDYWDNW